MALEGPDRRIGDYEVLGHWSTGRVSHVYLARKLGDHGAGALFAMKVPRPEYAMYTADQPGYVPGSTLGRSPHPHTLATREVLDQNGRLYMVTDFAHGETLDVVLAAQDHGPWPVTAALLVGLHVSWALEFIHLRPSGPVPYGRVSPANITVGYDGVARLLDSGLVGHDHRHGQARYLSPEQAAGMTDLDARVDVHGVGLVLWELLTGQPVLQGGNDTEIRAAVLSGAALRPSSRGASCDPSVDELVMKALSVERGQRFENATALARALEQEILRLDPDAGSPLLAELMQATFPAQVDRLDRLLELWATPPRPELLERPDGPLSAIRSAIAERHRPAEQNLAELDATLQALAHSLPPLSPDLMEPEPSVDLTAPSHSVTHHPAPAPQRPPPRRGLLLWVLAAGALALGGGVYMARGGSTIPQGRLRIVTEPHGADVQIDGEAMGTTPVTVPGLRGDVEHKVVIRLEGYATVERKVRFGGGETRSLTLDLVPAGSEEPPSADEGDEVDFKDNPY
ncbi:MAG: PEGA domain-containing protein [Deltaproteobacteria bacterium]|nr:PEGA domain-containing protein [Deltaproteobacteria bacterium]